MPHNSGRIYISSTKERVNYHKTFLHHHIQKLNNISTTKYTIREPIFKVNCEMSILRYFNKFLHVLTFSDTKYHN